MNKEELFNKYTCIVFKDDTIVFSSKEKGIKPIIDIINLNINIESCIIYDILIGKAAALLYSYLKVKKVYTKTISELAIPIFKKNNIEFEYDIKTKQIINRNKTGLCPMEEVVLNIDNPKDAVDVLVNKLKSMRMK